MVAMNEVDRGPTETAAGQAGSEAAFEGARDIDQRVEFGSAVLEEIPRAGVTLKHELTELGKIAVTERASAKDDALDFADDVIGALVFAPGQFGFVGGKVFCVDRAQRFSAEFAGSGFAVCPQRVVFSTDQFMFDAGVGDDDHDLAEHGDMDDGIGLAIEFNGVKCLSEKGRNLVEQTALDTDELVLGSLAEFGDFEAFLWCEGWELLHFIPDRRGTLRQGVRDEVADRQGGGYFQGGGAAHAGAHRNVGVNGPIEAPGVDSAFTELIEDAFNVIRPGGIGILLEVVDEEPFAIGKGGGSEFDFAISTRRGGHVNVFVDGQGKDQALIVIGMVAQ